MGMWQAGQSLWVGVEDAQVLKAIDAALDHGITSFDTAEEYGNGHSEKLLGKALKGRRAQAQILTKVFSDHLRPPLLREACERSLRNLQTDYIDLYQIHWPSGSWNSESVPIDETMAELVKLKDEGKIRAIGVSNFSQVELQAAMQYGDVDSLQSPYSLLWRHLEQSLIPFARQRKISILAYSPLAHGILAGKVLPADKYDAGDNRRKVKLLAPENYNAVKDTVDKLGEIAQAKRVSLSQLALAWVIQRGVYPIAGTRLASQIEENAKALGLNLTAEEIKTIEATVEKVAGKFRSDSIPWFWNP